MDVDVDNFEQAVELLERHLPRAAYVSVDLEMTGIVSNAATQVSNSDTPAEQYSKGCAVVQRPYHVVQVGLSLFEEKKLGQWECRPFNIFVFPQPLDEKDSEGRQVAKSDPFLGLSASTALFLRSNGFDFNRWITKGVSYTRSAMEATLLKLLPNSRPPGQDRNGEGGGSKRENLEASKPQDIKIVEETMTNVDQFITEGGREMKLPQMNSFLALVVRQKIGEKHPKLIVEKRPSEKNAYWQERWLLNLDEEGLRQRDAARRKHVMSLIGFRRVWDLLKLCRTPMVFHNGFFDLLFLVSAFEEALPGKLVDFKALVHKAFPIVYDTKILAESKLLRGQLGSRSALPELAAGLDERLAAATLATDADGSARDAEGTIVSRAADKLVFSLPDGFQQYAAGGHSGEERPGFHCAGFDAYQTGRIFAYYHSVLGELKTNEFTNRIFLMRSAFYLNLAEEIDVLAHNSIGRYVQNIDTKLVTNRSLSDILGPILENGKRRLDLRWCGDNRSLLLILHVPDIDCSNEGRAACEKCLDEALQKLKEQGRLEFSTLEDHCRAKARDTEVPISDGEDVTRPSKRQRSM